MAVPSIHMYCWTLYIYILLSYKVISVSSVNVTDDIVLNSQLLVDSVLFQI